MSIYPAGPLSAGVKSHQSFAFGSFTLALNIHPFGCVIGRITQLIVTSGACHVKVKLRQKEPFPFGENTGLSVKTKTCDPLRDPWGQHHNVTPVIHPFICFFIWGNSHLWQMGGRVSLWKRASIQPANSGVEKWEIANKLAAQNYSHPVFSPTAWSNTSLNMLHILTLFRNVPLH